MSRAERRAKRKVVRDHDTRCVVCSKVIPRKAVALWVTDRWTGQIFGAHMKCGDGPTAQKAMLAGLKAAMTTPQWVRFRWLQIRVGQKRAWSKFAARWTSSPKTVG